MKTKIKTLIKKILAWVLKDDLAKLKKTLRLLEEDNVGVRYQLYKIENSNQTDKLRAGLEALRKWDNKPSRAIARHKRALAAYEKEYLVSGIYGVQELYKAEEEIRNDLLAMCSVLTKEEADACREQALSVMFDFENPDIRIPRK